MPAPTDTTTGPIAAADYAALYDDYWSRADRWGSDSFTDPDWLAHQLLVSCGGGRTLDAGCGMGRLVRTLLRKGVDATGIDIAEAPIANAALAAPGRFLRGSVLALPFGDGTFDTVVSTDCLEHLAEADVAAAIAELRRVSAGSLFVNVATRPDREKKWHLTVRDRAWWEARFFEAGLRKHPRAHSVQSYESLEAETGAATIVLEKVPDSAAREFPLAALAAERGLHMDMLRESGRRSDAHLARYAAAAGFVRRGDAVLDAACGLGYGAAVLARSSPLARLIGVDSSESAVRYAAANFGPTDPRCEFRAGDCEDLSSIPDNSVDVVVSFETLEHLRSPERFIAAARRVLRPSGRLIASVPNDWTDETGRDPNPHHQHVYTWERLREQVRAGGFLIERAYAQTAGSGMKLTDRPRRLRPVTLDDADGVPAGAEAEWWLVVAMKPPTGPEARAVPFEETAFDPSDDPAFNTTAFGRDYDNPWLGRAMVTIGHRATEPRLLTRLAEAAIAESRPDSADAGAALCVLAYRRLESQAGGAGTLDGFVARLEAYDRATEGSAAAHVHRWRVSNRYAAARLLLAAGRRDEARRAFLRCAELDPVVFSPLLASKTVDALFNAGLIAWLDGDAPGARAAWERGLTETRRVLQGDWLNIWNSPARPMSFGMPEVAGIADAASRCAWGLHTLEDRRDRPGRAWAAMHSGTNADLRAWIGHLERGPGGGGGDAGARSWLESQVANWKALAERREAALQEMVGWTAQLQDGKTWLESQVGNWRGIAEQREAAIRELRDWAEQLERGKAWLEGELGAARSAAERAAERAGLAERAGAGLRAAVEDLRARLRHLEETLREREDELRSLHTPMGLLRSGARVFTGRGREPSGPGNGVR